MTTAETRALLDKATVAASLLGTLFVGLGGLLTSVVLVASGVASIFAGIFLYFAGADWE